MLLQDSNGPLRQGACGWAHPEAGFGQKLTDRRFVHPESLLPVLRPRYLHGGRQTEKSAKAVGFVGSQDVARVVNIVEPSVPRPNQQFLDIQSSFGGEMVDRDAPIPHA
jgi:hypothetical protein